MMIVIESLTGASECQGFSNPPGDPPDENTGLKDLVHTTEEGICKLLLVP